MRKWCLLSGMPRPGQSAHGFIAGPTVGPGDHYCACECCEPLLHPLLYTRHVPVILVWRSMEIVSTMFNYVVDEQVLI